MPPGAGEYGGLVERAAADAEAGMGPVGAKLAETIRNSARRAVKGKADHVRRPSGTVYHFLLPDSGMVDYRDKAAKALESCQHEADRKVAEGLLHAVHRRARVAEMEVLSDRVDELWAAHTEQLARDHRETEDTLPVWGQPTRLQRERLTTNTWKDRIRAQGIFSEGTRTASPYRRLKLVMDYWCALWFWPIEAADRLPDREANS